MDKIRKVFKKTKNVVTAEPRTTTITGTKNETANSEKQISDRDGKIKKLFRRTEEENKEIKKKKKRQERR